MDSLVILSALASGLAVLAVTWAADKVGGTLGGVLATAPVTTAAALLFLSTQTTNDLVGSNLLVGSRSLFVALAAMPAYFSFLKFTTGKTGPRIVVALLLFVAVFTVGGLALARLPWSGPVWWALTVGLALVYLKTFLWADIPPKLLRGARPPLGIPEAVARFAAGAGVVFLVAWLRGIDPALGAAWTIFPGTYLVTLAVLGFGHGAAFSGRACQGGALGGLPLAAYLLVLWLVLPLQAGVAWAVAAQVPAWLAYFVVLVPLWRWRQARQASKLPRAVPGQEASR